MGDRETTPQVSYRYTVDRYSLPVRRMERPKNPDGTDVDGPRKKWRLNQKVVAATIAFAENTTRLDWTDRRERMRG